MGDRGDAFVPWSCDDLTPDLCDDLKVESGSLTVRGVSIRYWKYFSSSGVHHGSAEKLPIARPVWARRAKKTG